MELEEAIKKLRETQDSYLKDELDIAIETVLKALDSYKRRYEMAMEQNVKDYENSIPKKKIVNILNECKPNSTNTFIESQEKYIKLYESIKELLEG